MGKIKALAKYKISGRGITISIIFTLLLCALVLLGNFSLLISVFLNSLGLSFISQTAESVINASLCILGTILVTVVFSPLRLGCERWFLLSAKGEKAPLKEVFYYFNAKGIVKSVNAVLFCTLKKSAALILFLFPSVCLFAVLYFSFGEGEISLYISYALFGFIALIFLTGCVFYFIYTARYLAYYSIIVSNETIRPSFAFEKSVELTEGAYLKICLFKASFIPWFMLCAAVLPASYVFGYYNEAKIMLCVKNEQLKH